MRSSVISCIVVLVTLSTASSAHAARALDSFGPSLKMDGATHALIAGRGDQATRMFAYTCFCSRDGMYVSDRRGGRWTKPVKIPNSAGHSPQMSMAANGAAAVAWIIQGTPRRIGVSYRGPGASRWTPPAVVLGVFPRGTHHGLRIAVNGSGRIAMIWTHHVGDQSVQAAFGRAGRMGRARIVDGGRGDNQVYTEPSLGIDAAGRAMAIYRHQERSGTTIEQVLAGPRGEFGPPREAFRLEERQMDVDAHLSVDSSGRVVAAVSGGPSTAAVNLYAPVVMAGVSTTSSGITDIRQLTNTGMGDGMAHPDDPMTGPERHPRAEVRTAIDETGRSSILWMASTDRQERTVEPWMAHVSPTGVYSPSRSIGPVYSNRTENYNFPQLIASGGGVIVSWLVNEPGDWRVFTRSAQFRSGAAEPTWWPVRQFTRFDASLPVLALSRSGTATIAFGRGLGYFTATNRN